MDIKVNVWEEDILLPTYGIGKPEKNPMFFENRYEVICFVRKMIMISYYKR